MALDTNINVIKLDVLNEAPQSQPGQRRSEDEMERRGVDTDVTDAAACVCRA